MCEYKIYKIQYKKGSKIYSFAKIAKNEKEALEDIEKNIPFDISRIFDISAAEFDITTSLLEMDTRIINSKKNIEISSNCLEGFQKVLSEYEDLLSELTSLNKSGKNYQLFRLCCIMNGTTKRTFKVLKETKDEAINHILSMYPDVVIEKVETLDSSIQIKQIENQIKRTEIKLSTKKYELDKTIKKQKEYFSLKEEWENLVLNNKNT